MKKQITFLSALLVSLCGCTHFMHNTSALENIVEKENHPSSEQMSLNENHSEIPDQSIKEHKKKISDTQVVPEPFARTDMAPMTEVVPEPFTRTHMEKDKSPPPAREVTDSVLNQAIDFYETSQEHWQKGERENALHALTQAYSLIADTDTCGDPENVRQKEELGLMISKRILEFHASHDTVVRETYHAIPIVMNKHVRAEIDLLMKSRGKTESFFVKAYKRSGLYRPYIIEELEKAGLPMELSWLPLIESGFKTHALSKAKALGLWQFIPSTGTKFGLTRNRYVDERLDPEKSTRAAIAYLKELHNIFGDWTTALAAYNCGEGRVLNVIRRQKMSYLDNFWDMYEHLPKETAQYVPRFMAVLHIMSNPEKYGLDMVTSFSPLEYEIVVLPKQTHLKDIAKAISTQQKTLKLLNPELRHNIAPSGGYSLRVPPGKGDDLISRLEGLPGSSLPKTLRTVAYHKIKKGETLSTIAMRYDTTVKKILRANKMGRRHHIIAGRRLKIPLRAAIRHQSGKNSKSAYRPSKHVVKKGDSLWIIAKQYGTTAKKLRVLNKLPNGKLRIGQVLEIPGQNDKRAKNLKDDHPRSYPGKSESSFFEIAKRPAAD